MQRSTWSGRIELFEVLHRNYLLKIGERSLLTKDEARRIAANIAAGAVRSKRLDHLRLPLPAPANQFHCAKAGGEKPTGSNRAELPIPPFWSEARLAIRAAPEIRFVIPRQLRIALRELSPIASLCARSHAVLGPRKCLVETDPPRPTRLRRSKRRVRCNRESSWRWSNANGLPVHKF